MSNILIIKHGSLGDIVQISGVLRDIRENLKDKKTIWTQNAEAPYWKSKGKFKGDVGKIYGVQWRNFNGVDQIETLLKGIKTNPNSRRHILTAWNPAELHLMSLPPCHAFSQFFISENRLSCQLYQRSCDMFLGVPFNIASYALLTMMMAQVCNLELGDFVHTLGDAHLYSNHIDQAKLQLQRDCKELPIMKMNKEIKNLFDFTYEDFELINYDPHPHIKAAVAI